MHIEQAEQARPVSEFGMLRKEYPTMAIAAQDLSRIDFSDVADGELEAVPPGEILAREFLEPLSITPYRLATTIGVPQQRIGEILAGRRAITADTGLRLSRVSGLTDGL
jgi:antitoxin HigA-1